MTSLDNVTLILLDALKATAKALEFDPELYEDIERVQAMIVSGESHPLRTAKEL